MNKILCFIPTKNRHTTTLPLTLQSVVLQERKPDKLVIYDDGDSGNLNDIPVYQYIFSLLEKQGVEWTVIFGKKKGQHHGHQLSQDIALREGFNLVWRIDDDEIADTHCLSFLEQAMGDSVAIGGLVIDPLHPTTPDYTAKNTIEQINTKPNLQWFEQHGQGLLNVEHLYSSFLYRPGLAHYNLGLSQVAHREETLFTMELFKHGRLTVNPQAITHHFRNPQGGIRTGDKTMWEKDERIFQNILADRNKNIVVLHSGLGDNIMFKKIMDKLKIDILCTNQHELFKDFTGELINVEAGLERWGDIEKYNIYRWCKNNNHEDRFYKAYLKMYDSYAI